jgi:RHS repeat-associated protein
VDVLGAATNTAAVVVNNFIAYRKADYYRQELTVTNSTAAVWQGVTNVGFLPQSTNSEIISGVTGSIFVAQSPESFGFDADGNQTTNGRWTLSWDAKNQLTSMVSLTNAPTSSKRKLDFTYDYLGRRVQKIVSTNNGSSYVGQYTNRFVYDGWNVVAILDPGNGLLYSFRWGTDASGTMQDAGGVGGLISMTVHSGSLAGVYFYCYDGNHNVVALISAADGTVVAQYEYGPFGQLLRATGALALVNPFRFSTKFQDDEAGFLYYGYRYYNAGTGRWLSRDPMGEQGSMNLYSAFLNDSPDIIDRNGLDNWANPGAGQNAVHQVTIPVSQLPPSVVNSFPLAVPVSSVEIVRDIIIFVLPNPKRTCQEANASFGTAANPSVRTSLRISAFLAGTSTVILGVVEFVPGAGGVTKPLKSAACECVSKELAEQAAKDAAEEIARAVATKSTSGESANALSEALSRARPSGDRLEAVLDDGGKVIFRRDVGAEAHPLPGYPQPVDHWNIEVQSPIPGRPGRFEPVQNTHIVLDASGKPIAIIHTP